MLNIGAYNIVESINTMVFGNNKFRIRRSQSKASYLAYKRERGAPDSEGSYKRTMSPTARLEDWQQQQQQQHQHSANSREHDDPVLLRVTPYHPQQQPQQQQQIPQQQNQQSFHHHNHHHNHNSHSHHSHPQHQPHSNQQLLESPKSHSVDALHQRIEERNSLHSTTVMSKLSHELTKKLQATENRPESNNNSSTTNNNDCHNSRRHSHQESRDSHRERLSPQSALVLHDRNRQLDRERRKLAASCEPLGQSRLLLDAEAASQGIQDFYRERSATIEMTSRNVELLNRRNALAEKNASETLRSSSSSSNSSSSSSSSGNSNISSSSSNSITSSSNSSGRNSAKDENDEVSSVAAGNSSCNSRAKDKTEGRKDCGTGEKSVEKPPSPVTSPPRSPLAFARSEENLQAARGAISRRTASCSSSSSIEATATTTTVESTRGFREEFEATGGSETGEKFDGTTENSRRKVSSPSQTETNWTTTAGLMSPRTRSSQTEGPNAEIGRISLPRSRSSSMSSGSKISPCVSPQPGIEGLTLVQRSEVVLRVNAATSDAASQTDILDGAAEEQLEAAESGAPVAPEPRRKLREEIECEELSRDLASQLGPNDKLVPILVPAPDHKKPTDYVSDLFRVEATLQPRPRRPPSLESSNSAASVDAASEDDAKNGTMHSTPTTPLLSSDPGNPLSANSAYFTTSEGKARFLTRYSRDVTDKDIMSCSVNSTTLSNQAAPTNDSFHLRQKKEELVLRLDKKVVVLKAEQEAVREEGELNEALGARVASRVSAVARPTEASKYRLHVEEVGKITSLLLGLSGRLARAENALYGMPTNHPERKILESKRDKLMDQLEEAKILKSNIDKRSVNVSAILAKYLNDDEYADYQHFINMKAKLIMDGREIQDKVKLGEEQLAALKEAIN